MGAEVAIATGIVSCGASSHIHIQSHPVTRDSLWQACLSPSHDLKFQVALVHSTNHQLNHPKIVIKILVVCVGL